MSGKNYTCKDMIHESLLLFLVQLLKREKKKSGLHVSGI